MPVIPATWEVEIGRLVKVGDRPEQKITKIPISINKLGMLACIHHPHCVGGIGRRITV
jgi:hypothetical protein